MKKKIDITPKPKNPVMEEKVIGCIQDNLKARCGWLDHIFGKAQRLKSLENNRQYYPAFLNDIVGEYLPMFPNEEFGNFAFFYIDDAQQVTDSPRSTQMNVPFSCVVWGDTRKVSNASRTQLKESLLSAFGCPVQFGNVTINAIYERGENIYRGFNIEEIETQYLMQPYFGFRFEGVLKFYVDLC